MKRIALICMAVAILALQAASGAVPQRISYQGLLKDGEGAIMADGDYDITFRIYNVAAEGEPLWEEMQTVATTDGIFSVSLGDVVPLNPDFGEQYYLGIAIGEDPELEPRIRLDSVPFAFRAAIADSVVGGGVPGGIGGSGTPTYVPRFTGTTTIGNSALYDASGRIGLGLTNPTARLTIYDSEATIRLQSPATGSAWNDGLQIGPYTAGGLGFDFWNRENGFVRLATNNTERLRVTETGDVGIGATTPAAKLHVAAGGGSANIRLQSTHVDGDSWELQSGITGVSDHYFGIKDIDAGVLAMMVRDNGYVGIGTVAAPAERLEVNGTVKMAGFSMPAGAGAGKVLTSDGSGVGTWQTSSGGIGGGGSQYWLSKFLAGGTSIGNSMLYDNDTGKLGVGTSGPDARVEIEGASTDNDAVLHLDASWNPEIAMDCGNSDADAKIRFTVNGVDNNQWMIRYDGSEDRLKFDKDWEGNIMTLGYTNVPRVGIGTIAPSTMLEVKTATGFDVIRGETVGDYGYDYKAVIGKSIQSLGYGIGGDFEGGSRGVNAHVSPGNHYWSTYGTDSRVTAQTGYTGASYGVNGETSGPANNSYGVYGYAHAAATGTNCGVVGRASGGATNYAGYFLGDVQVLGTLYKTYGAFKIDHPLDPANKYLVHSFVESPDMMNIYNGNVELDAAGEALVELPTWFESLNQDFRYQLTCIGGFAPVYVAEEISGNHFGIAGGTADLKVSWQVTGIRHDPAAEQHRIPVEVDKPVSERGKYLNPEVYGLPASMGVLPAAEAGARE